MDDSKLDPPCPLGITYVRHCRQRQQNQRRIYAANHKKQIGGTTIRAFYVACKSCPHFAPITEAERSGASRVFKSEEVRQFYRDEQWKKRGFEYYTNPDIDDITEFKW